MLNNFTGGGQVFLHKIRMLTQVLSRSLMMSTLVSSIIIGMIRIKSRMHDIIKHDTKFGTHLIPQISRSMSFPYPT